MRGLKTQENERFLKYFELILQAASEQGAVFFADAGDGHEFSNTEIECEDMMGWLIPAAQADAFEALWMQSAVDDTWSDFYVWAVWYVENDHIKIRFEE